MFSMFAGAPNISNLNADAVPASFSGMLSSPTMAPQVVAYMVRSDEKTEIRRGDVLLFRRLDRPVPYNGVPIEFELAANWTKETEDLDLDAIEASIAGLPRIVGNLRQLFVLASEAVTWTEVPKWVQQRAGGARYVVSVPCTWQGGDVVRIPTAFTRHIMVDDAHPGDRCAYLRNFGIKAHVSVFAPRGASEHNVYVRNDHL